MVADIGDQQAVARLVNNQADVAIDPRRPEIGVLTVVDAVQLKTVAGRVHLKIEDARLHRLLVEAGEPVEGGGEGIRDEEVHLNLTDGQLWVIPVEFRDRIDPVVSVLPTLRFESWSSTCSAKPRNLAMSTSRHESNSFFDPGCLYSTREGA